MNAATLSIIIPVYNEEKTITTVLLKVVNAELIGGVQKEIIVVNDCSSDTTESRILDFQNQNPGTHIRYYRHDVNQGKGAALQTGIRNATGDYLVVQDADLEYDPKEYNILLRPVLEGYADVVYGSRFTGGNPHRVLFFFHTIGNRLLTFISNLFSNINLTDVETGYKLFKSEFIQSLTLREKRFGFEPEVTAKIAKIPGIRIYEVGISYHGRTFQEGKKITWKDGVYAIWCVLKYNIFVR
jgi:glycosyltransferase involved in cell wall biosynthesis